MEDNSIAETLTTIKVYLLYRRWRRKQYIRRFWIRDLYAKRFHQGDFANLVQEMREGDPEKHFEYFRMSAAQFDHVLFLVRDTITKKDTNFRYSVSPDERLALTLRFLASGDMQVSLSYSYRLGKTTVSNIIKETCHAIWETMAPVYVKLPSSEEEWIKVSQGFEQQWSLPNCIGAIDGKHVQIAKPGNSGSMFYNYKGTFSTVLLALCDAHYRFLMVDVGSYGCQSDGGIYGTSEFGIRMQNNDLNIPEGRILPGSQTKFPYYIVGDEAFPLSRDIMRPYPGKGDLTKRIYNLRVSGARIVIENTFGIMGVRWRIFSRTQYGSPENIDGLVKAAVCLHNYLMTDEFGKPSTTRKYAPERFADYVDENRVLRNGTWRENVASCVIKDFSERNQPNRHSRFAGVLRDTLAKYLCNEGAIPGQEENANKQ